MDNKDYSSCRQFTFHISTDESGPATLYYAVNNAVYNLYHSGENRLSADSNNRVEDTLELSR